MHRPRFRLSKSVSILERAPDPLNIASHEESSTALRGAVHSSAADLGFGARLKQAWIWVLLSGVITLLLGLLILAHWPVQHCLHERTRSSNRAVQCRILADTVEKVESCISPNFW